MRGHSQQIPQRKNPKGGKEGRGGRDRNDCSPAVGSDSGLLADES